MAKGTTDFARQTTEQAVQTTDWLRAIAETASHSLIFNGAWLKAARETLKWLIENEATIKQRLAP
jgi:hypothetical protein